MKYYFKQRTPHVFIISDLTQKNFLSAQVGRFSVNFCYLYLYTIKELYFRYIHAICETSVRVYKIDEKFCVCLQIDFDAAYFDEICNLCCLNRVN